MDNQIYEDFKLYFPLIADKVNAWHMDGKFELVAELMDGNVVLFDGMEKTLRRLPKDSSNMTEEECLFEFSKRLGRILFMKGISQTELSKRTGIDQAAISRYLSGKRAPTLYNLDKIAKALGCSVDDFRYIY